MPSGRTSKLSGKQTHRTKVSQKGEVPYGRVSYNGNPSVVLVDVPDNFSRKAGEEGLKDTTKDRNLFGGGEDDNDGQVTELGCELDTDENDKLAYYLVFGNYPGVYLFTKKSISLEERKLSITW